MSTPHQAQQPTGQPGTQPAAPLEPHTAENTEAHQHGYAREREAYLRRLKRIEGQVRGIQRMITEDSYCIDVVTQISAANSALHNVAVALLEDHLHHCVAEAIDSGDGSGDQKIAEAIRAIKRLMRS